MQPQAATIPGRSPVPRVSLPGRQTPASALSRAHADILDAIGLISGAEGGDATGDAARRALALVVRADAALGGAFGAAFRPLDVQLSTLRDLAERPGHAAGSTLTALRHLEHALTRMEQVALALAHPDLGVQARRLQVLLSRSGLGCVDVVLRTDGEGAVIAYRFGDAELGTSAPEPGRDGTSGALPGDRRWITRDADGREVLSAGIDGAAVTLSRSAIRALKRDEEACLPAP